MKKKTKKKTIARRRPVPPMPDLAAFDASIQAGAALAQADAAAGRLPRLGQHELDNGGGPHSLVGKVQVTLRLPAETLALYRQQGPGWQTVLAADLTRAAATLQTRGAPRAVLQAAKRLQRAVKTAGPA